MFDDFEQFCDERALLLSMDLSKAFLHIFSLTGETTTKLLLGQDRERKPFDMFSSDMLVVNLDEEDITFRLFKGCNKTMEESISSK